MIGKRFRIPLLATLLLLRTLAFADPSGLPPPPPPIDLSGWVQISPSLLFGTNPSWPRYEPDDTEGVNPAYAAWSLSPFDGRVLRILSLHQTVTREVMQGDPPVRVLYQSDIDSSMEIWMGDDGNLHAFASYESEINGVTDQSFMYGMLPTPPGTTAAALFASLVGIGPPSSASALRNVPMVPEPAEWSMMLAGLMALGAQLRKRRRAA